MAATLDGVRGPFRARIAAVVAGSIWSTLVTFRCAILLRNALDAASAVAQIFAEEGVVRGFFPDAGAPVR